VYAWAAGIEPGDPAAVRTAMSDGCAAPIALVQAIGEHFDAVDDPSIADAQPRLWLITRAAQPLALLADDPAAPAAPHQGVLWGLGRVIANERPSLRCTLVDIASGASDEAEQLFHEVRSGADDRQIVLEGVQRSVATLDRRPAPSAGARRRTIDTDEYRLVASQPGSLGHLRLWAESRRPLASDEIEVRIDAAGIN
jgi:hypothetical protein